MANFSETADLINSGRGISFKRALQNGGYYSLLLSVVLLSAVLVTRAHPWSQNIR